MADPNALVPDLSTLVKLASIAVHADEMTSPGAHAFDSAALRSLLEDESVLAYIARLDALALVPKKRAES